MTTPALVAVLSGILDVPPGSLGDDVAMADVETWDSLRHIDLIVTLEETFALQFDADEIVEMRSVGAIRSVLARRGAQVT